MPQPPTTPVQARELVRAVPFCAQRTFASTELQPLGAGGGPDRIVVQWDLAAGITDASQLLAGAYPDGSAGIAHATGPFLDAVAVVIANGVGIVDPGTLTVEYAVDRGCAYWPVTLGTACPYQTLTNISGLRITGRFVRVVLFNPTATVDHTITVDFGVYIRST